MTKRQTKAQRKRLQKDALLQRIIDIYSGANGGVVDEFESCFPVVLAKALPVMRETFGTKGSYIWSLHNLEEFETPSSACDYLFERGYRADKRFEGEAEGGAS